MFNVTVSVGTVRFQSVLKTMLKVIFTKMTEARRICEKRFKP